MRAVVLSIAMLCGLSGVAGAGEPRVELYTVGPGTTVFSRFGHAALCVVDDRSPTGRCYNYGTADFSTPIPLGWSVLRGRGRFWVSVASLEKMLQHYRREDRSLYRQVLPLSPAAAAGLVATLDRDALPANREYVYHHFADNCSTRPRDHVNAVTGGILARWGTLSFDRTFRDLVRDGLASDPLLGIAGELVMGRATDRAPTVYEAMFLPEVLRRGVSEALGVEPELLYQRRAPTTRPDPMTAARILWGAGVGLGLLLAVALWWPPTSAATRVLLALGAGALGLLFWGLAIVSPVPELRWNELVVVLWPTDLLLVGARMRTYVLVRTTVLLVAGLLLVVGVMVQPIGPVLASVLPSFCVLAAHRYSGNRRNDGHGGHGPQ